MATLSQFVFARSDVELEDQLLQAIDASNDDFAFRLQLQEILHFSELTFAHHLQLADITTPSDASVSASASSSLLGHSKPDQDLVANDYYEQGQTYSGGGGKEAGSWECSYRSQALVPVVLCGICFDNSLPDMFEGLHCLHRFCHSCMTRYIHSRLEERRHQVYCPHDSCGEALSPQECRYFLPVEIFDAWMTVILEAQIPESEKVYCPFPDCSGLLVKEDVAGIMVEEILNAECPFCNRMFCVKCKVPWHADLDCSQFQNLPAAERSEADLQFFKLARERKWQRCGKCKGMIELVYGCNHIKCRCGYEFCYECSIGWSNGRPNCICPRTNVNRLLQ